MRGSCLRASRARADEPKLKSKSRYQILLCFLQSRARLSAARSKEPISSRTTTTRAGSAPRRAPTSSRARPPPSTASTTARAPGCRTPRREVRTYCHPGLYLRTQCAMIPVHMCLSGLLFKRDSVDQGLLCCMPQAAVHLSCTKTCQPVPIPEKLCRCSFEHGTKTNSENVKFAEWRVFSLGCHGNWVTRVTTDSGATRENAVSKPLQIP